MKPSTTCKIAGVALMALPVVSALYIAFGEESKRPLGIWLGSIVIGFFLYGHGMRLAAAEKKLPSVNVAVFSVWLRQLIKRVLRRE
jgi:drug/metabolite transporter (DMT)-like permease